jgi:hypothetical protein
MAISVQLILEANSVLLRAAQNQWLRSAERIADGWVN